MSGPKIQPDRTRERGSSKINTILTLAALVAIVFVGVKVVPPYFAKYQFQDSIETESKFALSAYPRKGIEDIRDDVFKKAQDLDIPLKREAIRVIVTNGSVDIGADYTVPVDLLVYQFTLDFHLHADNHNI
jgi:hypothetical protein